MQVRPASPADLDAIAQLDPRVAEDPTRLPFLRDALHSEVVLSAVERDAVIGYAVLDHSFFGQAFLALLVVAEGARRRGVGTMLLQAAESHVRAPKLFTSTNRSNLAMQRLLESAGYEPSGTIENLDADDPELIYVRFFGRDAA
jgi:ribosomal protein S18 acetylase RimI-like enzyme